MAESSRRQTGPVIRSSSGRFCHHSSTATPSYSSSSSGFASYSSSLTSRSTSFLNRSTSPTRVNVSQSAPSLRFSLDRSSSPSRNQVVRKPSKNPLSTPTATQKRTCMCSPTNHPGSFRCSMHKNNGSNRSAPYPSNRLNARRSAMTNSLVRIGTVEGDLVKRALAALIRPSSHHQRRRAAFQPRPSRLSNMSTSE